MNQTTVSFTQGGSGNIIYNTGATFALGSNYYYTDYITVSSYKRMQYKRVGTSSTGVVTAGMAFYDTNKTYISGDPILINQSAFGYAYGLATVVVPEDAVYARFSYLRDTATYGNFEVYGIPEVFGIIVDNVQYLVGVEYDSMKRRFAHLEGPNTGVSILGRTIRDVLGSTYTYSMTIHALENYQEDYDTLYDLLTDTADYHNVSLPFGQGLLTFDAIIETADDTYKGYYNGQYRWDDLDVTFTPMQPQVV